MERGEASPLAPAALRLTLPPSAGTRPRLPVLWQTGNASGLYPHGPRMRTNKREWKRKGPQIALIFTNFCTKISLLICVNLRNQWTL
jgi:hypothetical protein